MGIAYDDIVGRYFRAGNVVKYPSLYRHGGCGGEVEVEKVVFDK